MKTSIYNQYVVLGDHTVVYNTKMGNAVSFPDVTEEKQIREFLQNEPSEELIDMGFVVEDDEDETEQSRCDYFEMKFMKSKKMNIMLIMTYSCNCNCAYCFEHLHPFAGETEKVDEVIGYIADLYRHNNAEELELHFFGGEPTLQVDKMVYVMNRLKELGVNVKPNVITNGTLFDAEKTEKLVAAGITSFQITVDGPKEIHDMRRPMKNGESAWDAICRSLTVLAAHQVSVTIRINVNAENVEYLEEVWSGIPQEVKDHPYTNVYIAPIVGCKIHNMKITLEDRARNLKRAWKIIHDSGLPISITPPAYAPCPYSSFDSAFYIDLYGNVYTCGGFVGKTHKIERNMEDRSLKFWNRIMYKPDDRCFRCPFYPVCMGGCKFEEEELGGHCQFMYLKEMYDEYYTKYAE